MTLTATQFVADDFNDILFDSTSTNNQMLIAIYAGELAAGTITAAQVAEEI